MSRIRTIEEINEKIANGNAVVLTAEEIIDEVAQEGAEATLEKVDVVTTATFGPMCSSGAFLNFGHSDPPIRMAKTALNDVEAYSGIAAVDAYIGATQLSETEGDRYGGAHVICDLISRKPVRLSASSPGTDCYPRKRLETEITLDTINEAYLFNPRNAYQNYGAAINLSAETKYTYMGTLRPHGANVTYATCGQLSPLLNDPDYRTIGIGTRLFLAGAQGYVAWQGTQF
ncbi:MAG TPA: homocysteine biosynthesis protein, partial [Thermotogota bacterium]|nr:homocysteine biosynthesis protein [Thermotogota bacterium]